MEVKIRASLKTRLVKEKANRCVSCKERPRRRAVALQEGLTQQMTNIVAFSQKGFLEMPFSKTASKAPFSGAFFIHKGRYKSNCLTNDLVYYIMKGRLF